MKTFPGFPSRPDYVAIPRVFFSDVLPFIQERAELLVTLHLFRLLGARRGYPRAVAQQELVEDRLLALSLSQAGADPKTEIPRGLHAAVARGTFLRAAGPPGGDWLLLNTPGDRRAAEAIRQGRVKLKRPLPAAAVPAPAPQQDIFTLYEETVGLLTPIVAERLQEAEAEYPAGWVREAFAIAAEQNVRKWSYIAGILERWKTEGRDDGTSGGHPEKAGGVDKYLVWPTARRPGR